MRRKELNEHEDLERQNTELKAGLERFNEDGERAGKFIEIVRRYTDFKELTTPMLNEFVEKILVGESGKKLADNRVMRSQKVDIYLNFIGKFDIPVQPETNLKPGAFNPEKEWQRYLWRAYYYRNREKILAKLEEKRIEKSMATQLNSTNIGNRQATRVPEAVVAPTEADGTEDSLQVVQ